MVDRVSTPVATNKMTPEEQEAHDTKMAAVADENATQITSTDSRTDEQIALEQQQADGDDGIAKRPDDVPEKFWDAEKGVVNVEALLKSQKDAEAALLAGKPKSTEGAEGTEGDDTPAGDEGAQQTAVTDATKEFADKGELSDATYTSLEKTGLSREMVDEYIDGQKAIVTQLETSAFGEFGGKKESYEAATEWAAENLNDEEISALDVQLTSRNPGIVKQGAAALAAKYAANADITPDTTISGGGNNANTGAHFKSGAEMRTAMSDPKYKTDPNFRAEVAQKIEAADRAGVNLFT